MLIRRSVRLAVCLFSGVLALAAFQTAEADKEKAKDKEKASLQGKIVNAVTGEALKKVSVILSGHGKNVTAETDEKGQFSFDNVDPGRFTLMAQKNGFAPGAYGARGNSTSGTPVELARGQDLKDVNWKLAPNAVITGKVLDVDGEPIQNAMVMPMLAAWEKGKRLWAPAGQAMTNDQGEYRVANLKAGKYIVMASNLVNNVTSSLANSAKPATDKAEPGYVTTYYPGVSDQETASPVDVQVGGEVGRIDVHMVKVDSFRVKGHWDNAPTQGKMTLVVLTPKGSGILGMLSANRAQLNPDGSFEFRGVPPGDYLLSATQDFLSPMGGQMPVQVKDKHLSGVVMQAAAPVDLSGSIVVEGRGSDKVDLKHLSARLNPVDFISINPPNAKADEAGKLSWGGVTPGKYEVRADNGSEQLYLKAVRYAEREVGEDGLDLSAGVAGAVQITLSTEVCEVRGNVTGDDGAAMAGVTVVLAPDSRSHSLFRTAVADQKGMFDFKNLPPGDYKLLAWEEMEPGQYENPEFLAKYIGKAETVGLKANDQKVFSLKALPVK
ncbi:MAG TPA: carboxypeptidase-like regulatory domain-containing protein [Candidatus Sulfopaludibacter sp.]|jgi:protocatechuate 3,4-dioxygenase beta subunit|nr:carboxypeptidase-like regulatory domain-containing protein [Candidatus Sulfopaludibacter sp.]